jgi:hypothetical protein
MSGINMTTVTQSASAKIDVWQANIQTHIEEMTNGIGTGTNNTPLTTGQMVAAQQGIKDCTTNIQALNNALKEDKDNKAAVWCRA